MRSPCVLLLEYINMCAVTLIRAKKTTRNGWGLFYGTEWNNGLNRRTERFLKVEATIAATQVILLAVCCFQGRIATIKATEAAALHIKKKSKKLSSHVQLEFWHFCMSKCYCAHITSSLI